jgi:hypothetical protein
MNTTEIEDGEVYSDNDEPVSTISKSELDIKLNNDEKNELNKLIKYDDQKSDLESGELSDNPYDEEDETMIELKMKALKSLLNKGDSSTSNKIESKKSKVKKKKLQQRKLPKRKSFSFASTENRTNALADFSSSSQHISNGDNYNLEEMDIEDPMQHTKQNAQMFAEMMVKMMMMSSMPGTSANTGNFMLPLQVQHQPASIDMFSRALDFNNISPSMFNPLQLNAMSVPEPNWQLNNNTNHSPGGSNFMHASTTNHLKPIHQNKFNQKKANSFSKKNKKFKNSKRLEHNLNIRTNQNTNNRNNNKNFNNAKTRGKFTSPNLKAIQTTSDEQTLSKSAIQCAQTSPQMHGKQEKREEKLSPERFDIDERFVDKQSHMNDVDYRQFPQRPIEVVESAQLKATVETEQNPEEQCEEPKEKEEDEQDDEEYLNELRKKLLDNVNEKRLLKKQEKEEKEKEKREMQVKMDEDLAMLKRKLIENEHELTTMNKKASNTQALAFKPKPIAPIIIRLSSKDNDDDDDDDDDDDSEAQTEKSECDENVSGEQSKENKIKKENDPNEISSLATFQSNLSSFLSQAKQMATQILKNTQENKKKLAQTTRVNPSDSTVLKNDSNELDKKKMITNLRDKINIKSKLINELNNRSKLVKQSIKQKETNVEVTKLKINSLREQLQAAEKILSVNSESLANLRVHDKLIDSKLEKHQHAKKMQQQLLQKIISTPAAASISSSTSHEPVKTSPMPIANPPPAKPPLPIANPPPPLPSLPPTPKLLISSSAHSVAERRLTNPSVEPNKMSSQSNKQSLLQIVRQSSKSPLKKSVQPSKQALSDKPETINVSSNMIELSSQMTLGAMVAATASSSSTLAKVSNKTSTTLLRPNLYTSETTNTKLEQLAAKNQDQANSNTSDNHQIVVNAKLVASGQLEPNKAEKHKTHMSLLTCLENVLKDFPYVHNESFDVWSNESIFVSQNLKEFSIKSEQPTHESSLSSSNETHKIYKIDDIGNYDSPLKCFRGYRFSKLYEKANDLEEAYSKFYCNTIDIRKQFCPFDLHGSCKDSNCVYQHSNVMIMDNFQRTEHFLTYCPELLELSAQPSAKEASKKLKMYANTFMSTHLNKMSIKDYFKHLYDHIMANRKAHGDSDESTQTSTILSRHGVFLVNHTSQKSIGVYEQLEIDSTQSSDTPSLSDSLIFLFDQIIMANTSRLLELKLNTLLLNNKLDIDHLSSVGSEELTLNELIVAWIFLARHVYVKTGQIEKLLNVLSHALEVNAQCELLWLVYLKSYLSKKNSMSDYHEICMLCMDNLITYDLVWFMMSTCSNSEYVQVLIERYEKYLLSTDNLEEFEQTTASSTSSLIRLSFYLVELILFQVHLKSLKLKFDEIESNMRASCNLLLERLRSNALISRLDPIDLCLLWLCTIHMEAFNYMPQWLQVTKKLMLENTTKRVFWKLDERSMRIFNWPLFESIRSIYSLRERAKAKRTYDFVLLPWKKHQLTCESSLNKLQNLFYESLKSISTCCSLNKELSKHSGELSKEQIRSFSLPLFINLIHLELANKRYETAHKLCERLLKSPDAESLKEVWLVYIHIQRSKEFSSNLTSTIQNALSKFPLDGQIAFTAARFYASIVRFSSFRFMLYWFPFYFTSICFSRKTSRFLYKYWKISFSNFTQVQPSPFNRLLYTSN